MRATSSSSSSPFIPVYEFNHGPLHKLFKVSHFIQSTLSITLHLYLSSTHTYTQSNVPPAFFKTKHFTIMKYLPLGCKSICSCIVTSALIVVILISTLAAFTIIPLHLQVRHEAAHFEELDRLKALEERWTDKPWGKSFGSRYGDILELERAVPYNKRLLPLVHDITQLRSSSYLQQMRMHLNWTAEYPGDVTWIYFGGTSRDQDTFWKAVMRKMSPFVSLPGRSCTDAPQICNAFNDGFNALLEYYHTHRAIQQAGGGLTFVDCDVSSRLCDTLGVTPVMLAHVETKSPCASNGALFDMSCSVKWTYISLPLKKMPFQRIQSLPNGMKVPVFPTAFEQLHSMISFSGTVNALEYEEHEISEFTVVKDPMDGTSSVLMH
jgi:hypothetical protein